MIDLREKAQKLDEIDPLNNFRDEFLIPKRDNGEECLYLCGNSLGLQPREALAYVRQEMTDWARLGVEAHEDAQHPWIPYHAYMTEYMSDIAGAKESEVVTMNSLTVNLHLLLVSFYRPTQEKHKIIIEKNAFPSDIYAFKSQIRFHGYDPDESLLVIPYSEGKSYTEPADILEFIDKHGDETATILMGGVNFYNGQVMPLKSIAEIGHKHNCVVGFDMAHGAGNIEMNLHDNDVDFAAWCSYKYLNSGPGSLSGVFIHERFHNKPLPKFNGWWGHDKSTRFLMPNTYKPMPTAEAWQLSNPPILPLACMRASLELFAEAGMKNIRKKSVAMMQFADECLGRYSNAGFSVITPTDESMRGCQLSIQVHGKDKSVINDLRSHGVVADWREPDVIRIAFAPLYNQYAEVEAFSRILNNIADGN